MSITNQFRPVARSVVVAVGIIAMAGCTHKQQNVRASQEDAEFAGRTGAEFQPKGVVPELDKILNDSYPNPAIGSTIRISDNVTIAAHTISRSKAQDCIKYDYTQIETLLPPPLDPPGTALVTPRTAGYTTHQEYCRPAGNTKTSDTKRLPTLNFAFD